MGVLGFALAVSMGSDLQGGSQLTICDGLEDFALIEASYMIVRLLQKYPIIKMTEHQAYQKPGSESQKMTLVMSVGDGCVLHLSEEQS